MVPIPPLRLWSFGGVDLCRLADLGICSWDALELGTCSVGAGALVRLGIDLARFGPISTEGPIDRAI